MANRKPKIEKPDGPQQVTVFLSGLTHPLKPQIEAVRKMILSANVLLTEHIKWNAPSFQYQGEDRITFNLHGKNEFRLIFHCGATPKNLPHHGRLVEDTTGLLGWITDDRAIVTFTHADDIQNKEAPLKKVVNQWIAATNDLC
jgi:hypothetical protein